MSCVKTTLVCFYSSFVRYSKSYNERCFIENAVWILALPEKSTFECSGEGCALAKARVLILTSTAGSKVGFWLSPLRQKCPYFLQPSSTHRTPQPSNISKIASREMLSRCILAWFGSIVLYGFTSIVSHLLKILQMGVSAWFITILPNRNLMGKKDASTFH